MTETKKYKVFITNIFPEAAVQEMAKIALIKEWKENFALPYEVLKKRSAILTGYSV